MLCSLQWGGWSQRQWSQQSCSKHGATRKWCNQQQSGAGGRRACNGSAFILSQACYSLAGLCCKGGTSLSR